jgi:hypothetical protein
MEIGKVTPLQNWTNVALDKLWYDVMLADHKKLQKKLDKKMLKDIKRKYTCSCTSALNEVSRCVFKTTGGEPTNCLYSGVPRKWKLSD